MTVNVGSRKHLLVLVVHIEWMLLWDKYIRVSTSEEEVSNVSGQRFFIYLCYDVRPSTSKRDKARHSIRSIRHIPSFHTDLVSEQLPHFNNNNEVTC